MGRWSRERAKGARGDGRELRGGGGTMALRGGMGGS